MGPAHVEWMYTCSRVFCAWQRLLCRKFHHLWQGRCWTPTRGELYQHSVLKSVFYLTKAFSIQELCFFLLLTNCWKLRGTSWGGRSISQSCNVVEQEWFSILFSKTSSEFIHLLKFIMNSGVYLAHIKSSLHSKQ